MWDKREFKNLDNNQRTGHPQHKDRAAPFASSFARDGAADELDLDATIAGTARQGWLDIHMRAGTAQCCQTCCCSSTSADRWTRIVKLCEELFSAATTEFKNLEFFYFHNCPYEGVWKDNRRRFTERTPTWDVLHKYGHDYKLVFVGDASMSPI